MGDEGTHGVANTVRTRFRVNHVLASGEEISRGGLDDGRGAQNGEGEDADAACSGRSRRSRRAGDDAGDEVELDEV